MDGQRSGERGNAGGSGIKTAVYVAAAAGLQLVANLPEVINFLDYYHELRYAKLAAANYIRCTNLNKMMLIYAIAIIILPLIYGLNELLCYVIIKRAIKNSVEPLLKAHKLFYSDFKWLGFFNQGDFKNQSLKITPISISGKSSLSIYADIYYKEANWDLSKAFTIRIDVLGVSIKNIIYSEVIRSSTTEI